MKWLSKHSRILKPVAGVFLFGVLALTLSGCKERVAIHYDNPNGYYSDVNPYGYYYNNGPGYSDYGSQPYYQPFYYYNTPNREHHEFGEHHGFGEHHFGGEHFEHHGSIFGGGHERHEHFEHGGHHGGHHDDD